MNSLLRGLTYAVLFAIGEVSILLIYLPFVRHLLKIKSVSSRIDPPPIGNAVVWFHAASVGEINGIKSVIEQVIASRGASRVCITTTSETGLEHAQELFRGAEVRILPVDSPRLFKQFLSKHVVRLLVVNETELWPSMLFIAKEQGLHVMLVNARISDQTAKIYALCSFAFGHILRLIDVVYAQSEVDKARLVRMGISERNILVAGSTKYEKIEIGHSNFSKCLDAPYGLRVTFGSIREDEEDLSIRVITKLLSSLKGIQVILAPRHVPRFEAVAKKLEKSSLRYIKKSAFAPEQDVGGASVILLDTIGDLACAYKYSDIAVVGGTFGEVGGHNIIEPAQFGVPVIVGESLHNNRAAQDSLLRHHALVIAKTERELLDNLIRILGSKPERESLAKNSLLAASALEGVSKVVLGEIQKVLGDEYL